MMLGMEIDESTARKEGIKVEDLMQLLIKMNENRNEAKKELMKNMDETVRK